MNEIVTEIKARTVAEAIAESLAHYTQQGYRIIARPQPEDMPASFLGLHPDYLAVKPDNSIAIQVRLHHELADEEVMRFARTVKAEPGWNFSLVIPDRLPAPDEPAFPRVGPTNIDGFLRISEELRERGEFEAGRVLLGTAIESAARLLAEKYDVPQREESLSFLLRQMVAEGLLSRAYLGPLTQAILETPVSKNFSWDVVTDGVRELLSQALGDERK